MATFKISEPNKAPKWIKSVNGAEGTIEFQDTKENAYCKDSGFFADSEFEFIKFHFKKKYPEIEYMSIDNGWGDSYFSFVPAAEEPVEVEAADGVVAF